MDSDNATSNPHDADAQLDSAPEPIELSSRNWYRQGELYFLSVTASSSGGRATGEDKYNLADSNLVSHVGKAEDDNRACFLS